MEKNEKKRPKFDLDTEGGHLLLAADTDVKRTLIATAGAVVCAAVISMVLLRYMPLSGTTAAVPCCAAGPEARSFRRSFCVCAVARMAAGYCIATRIPESSATASGPGKPAIRRVRRGTSESSRPRALTVRHTAAGIIRPCRASICTGEAVFARLCIYVPRQDVYDAVCRHLSIFRRVAPERCLSARLTGFAICRARQTACSAAVCECLARRNRNV